MSASVQENFQLVREANKTREDDAQFAATFNQAAVGMAHVNLDGTFLKLNRKYCEIVGYSAEELLRLTFQEITHPEDLSTDVGYINKLLSGMIETYSMEKRYKRKSKEYVWVNLTVSLVRHEDNTPHYFIAVIEDIEKRKRAERELLALQEELEKRILERTVTLEETSRKLRKESNEKQELEDELNRFFTISQDAMIIFDINGRFRRFNSAFATLLGYSEEELRQVAAVDLIHPDDRERSAQAAANFRNTHSLIDFENRYIKKDGTVIYLSWNATLYSKQSLIYAIARDMTAAKTADAARNDERAKVVAASKMAALGRMAAGLAHEINNPLTIVYGHACQLKKLLSRDVIEKSKLQRSTQQIELMSLRIVDIINGLRTFAREGTNDPYSFNHLESILKNTLSFCMAKMHVEEIELKLNAIPADIEVFCNAVQISQVLLNLLNNARDAVESTAHKEIAVEYVETETHVGLAIQDSGPGLTPKAKLKMFEPFFTTKEVGKGTGLGLSVSKGIIESHGGRIYCDENYQRGARFVILLPRVATS